jgi:putative molybdopterin biosynthesis protein
MKQKVYLKMTTLEDAKKIWLDKTAGISSSDELINVEESYDRITAEPVIAKISSPGYHSAAMDGIAVKASTLVGASETSPVYLELGKEAISISTGDPIPYGMDAVVKIEDVRIQNNKVEIMQPVVPYQHVRLIGEDIVTYDMLLPVNHTIRAQDIGAMLAGGITKIRVRKKPIVGIMPTGCELVQPGDRPPGMGEIIEYNTRVLKCMIEEYGGIGIRLDIVPDEYDMIRSRTIEILPEVDILIINAGSSAGVKDYTPEIIQELGELFVHGVTMMPGKPVALGMINNKPVIGLPGFPVAAMLTMEEFVIPVIRKMLGLCPVVVRDKIIATVTQKLPSKIGLEEFVRVNIGYFPDRSPQPYVAVPQRQGSGVITSMVNADGILRLHRLSEGVNMNSNVEVELLREKEDIHNNVLLIGSHDNMLDILSNCVKNKYPEITLRIINIGSIGGLLALKRGECHITTCHLLDEHTGEYNIPYITQLLPDDMNVSVITLAWREQGLIVSKGNPKNIHTLQDLVKDGIMFINRQKGSGTRILLDYELKKIGISGDMIQGYDSEVFTHTAVCAAIQAGIADVGMGIRSAACAFGLDFIPIVKERYDMVIPNKYLSLKGITAILDVIHTDEFKQQVIALKGYDLSECGCNPVTR